MTSNTQSKSLVFVSLVCFSLAGCALNSSGPAATNVAGAAISGSAYGGQQPVANSVVSLHAVGTSGYGSVDSTIGTVTADSHGNFFFPTGSYTCPQSNTPVYLKAVDGDPGAGNNASLVEIAGIGACGAAVNVTVQINEISTAVTAAALQQFFTTTLGSGSSDSFGGPSSLSGSTVTYSKGLTAANAITVPTLLNLPAGIPQAATSTVTVDDAKLRTIANIIASCVNSTGSTSATEVTTPCGKLFAAATPPGASTRPSDTLQAAVSMARYPTNNVSTLVNLVPGAAPFGGGAVTLNDFTVAVKYSTTAMALTVNSGTNSNLDIDATGNVWLPTTLPAGVAMFSPAAQAFSGPFPAAGLVHPQNVAIGTNALIHLADAGSGILAQYNATGTGAATYNTGGTSLGAVQLGSSDQIWVSFSSATGNQLAEYPGGVLGTVVTNVLLGATSHYATSLAVQANNDVYSATSTGTAGYMEKYPASNAIPLASVVASYGAVGSGQITRNGTTLVTTAPAVNKLCPTTGCLTANTNLSVPQGVATDGANNLWIANSGSASVLTTQGSGGSYAASAGTAYLHGPANGNLLVNPYGVGIDASGNVWLSNATANGQPYVLTEIVGAAAPTITPLAAQISGGVNLVGTKPTN